MAVQGQDSTTEEILERYACVPLPRPASPFMRKAEYDEDGDGVIDHANGADHVPASGVDGLDDSVIEIASNMILAGDHIGLDVEFNPTAKTLNFSAVPTDLVDVSGDLRATALTGLTASATRLDLTPTDTVLSAFGKIKKWFLEFGTAAWLNVAVSGDAASGEIVKGNDTRLTNSRPPSGSAGGDLSGNYPNPTVAKIAGISVSTTTPSNAQVLRYNSTSGLWESSTITYPVASVAGKTGVVTLVAADVSDFATAADARIAAQKGVANGVVPLGSDAKIAATYLPSYVDDVIESANLAAFPVTGEAGKLYTALDTGKIYRWSGSVYIEISPSPGSTDAVPEGSGNLYFTEARARATLLTGLTAAATRINVAATDSMLTAWGKFVKLFNDLGSLAFKSAVDLSSSDATGTIAAARMPAHTGDVTNTAGNLALTIGNNTVGNAKLATVATATIKGRASASTGNVEDLTISQVLDLVGSTQGMITYRGASGWSVLSAGTAGQVLQTGGAGSNPSWVNQTGGGSALTKNTTTSTAQTLTFTNNAIVEYLHTTTGNTTFTLSGGADGDIVQLYVKIGSAGHTLTFSTVTSWMGGTTAPSWSTSAGTKYIMSFVRYDSVYVCTGLTIL